MKLETGALRITGHWTRPSVAFTSALDREEKFPISIAFLNLMEALLQFEQTLGGKRFQRAKMVMFVAVSPKNEVSPNGI
ncbi:hypothetical protein PQQ53_28025 [Paraburkholderia strydomiana]|uniref:hypothetical protein n=1 Tax=Paraburkholderia strydomiana TaxID=1245417 RepID=UPI0038B9BF52